MDGASVRTATRGDWRADNGDYVNFGGPLLHKGANDFLRSADQSSSIAICETATSPYGLELDAQDVAIQVGRYLLPLGIRNPDRGRAFNALR